LYKDSNAGMKAIHYAIENEKESVVELLCEHYTDLNVPDETGMTPLHYAVAHEDEDIIEILLRKDVDINQQDQGGESAYDLASARIKKFINSHKKDAESSE
jgi:ankyrin repeat protein